MNDAVAQAKINELHETFSYGVIYVYSIPDGSHKGRLKIGGTTIDLLKPSKDELDDVAHARIKQQTKTADIKYVLEHVELALTNDNSYFSDYQVHNVLKRSGYSRRSENIKNAHSEWFQIDLSTALNAIKAVKEGREALSTNEKTLNEKQPFPFRPNQLDAIEKTTKVECQVITPDTAESDTNIKLMICYEL